MEIDLRIMIAKMSEILILTEKRLDKLENNQEEIRNLVVSTNLLAQSSNVHEKDIDKINLELHELNSKPSKLMDLAKGTIVSAFFGSIVAALVSLLITS